VALKVKPSKRTSTNPAWAAYKSDEFALKIISTNMMKKHHAHFTIRPEGEYVAANQLGWRLRARQISFQRLDTKTGERRNLRRNSRPKAGKVQSRPRALDAPRPNPRCPRSNQAGHPQHPATTSEPKGAARRSQGCPKLSPICLGPKRGRSLHTTVAFANGPVGRKLEEPARSGD